MKYLWLLNETVIAEFESYNEAIQELERLPENFEVCIGEKSNKIPKKSIVVCPEFYYTDNQIEDEIAKFLKTLTLNK